MPQITFCHGRFRIDDHRLQAPREGHNHPAIADERIADAIRHSFDNPLNFPPIAEAVMNEDSIAIVVEPDTPCGLSIARQVSDWFIAKGNPAERIVIVCAEKVPRAENAQQEVPIVQHDATDNEHMAYLLADAQGDPVYVNRALHDADIVVPIGTGDAGQQQNRLCPVYCDAETRNRTERMKPGDVAALSRMINSNLGVFWQIRLITAPGEQVLQIVTGESDQVLVESAQQGLEAWNLSVEQPASLVLATIESETSQSWSNLRNALVVADQAATSAAVLVVCTDLTGTPPANWPNSGCRSKRMDEELAAIFSRHHIYLASRLTQDATEQFGFGFVNESEQIQKLIDQHDQCLLLRDAHRVGLKTKEAV